MPKYSTSIIMKKNISTLKNELFNVKNVKKLNTNELVDYASYLSVAKMNKDEIIIFAKEIKKFMFNYIKSEDVPPNYKEAIDEKKQEVKEVEKVEGLSRIAESEANESCMFSDMGSLKNEKKNNEININMPSKKELMTKAKTLKTKLCPPLSKMSKKQLEEYVDSKSNMPAPTPAPSPEPVEKVKKVKKVKTIKIKIKKPKKVAKKVVKKVAPVVEEVKEDEPESMSEFRIKMVNSAIRKLTDFEYEEYENYKEFKEEYDSATNNATRERIGGSINRIIEKVNFKIADISKQNVEALTMYQSNRETQQLIELMSETQYKFNNLFIKKEKKEKKENDNDEVEPIQEIIKAIGEIKEDFEYESDNEEDFDDTELEEDDPPPKKLEDFTYSDDDDDVSIIRIAEGLYEFEGVEYKVDRDDIMPFKNFIEKILYNNSILEGRTDHKLTANDLKFYKKRKIELYERLERFKL